jgi:hypothetical protein
MKKSAAFLAGAMVVAAASPAAALGLNYGVRAGYGIGMPDPDDGVDSASVIDAGLAVMLDLAILGLEVDLLYNRQTTKAKGGGEANVGNIAIPILARGSFPVIPMFLSLDFGGGLEPRFPISAEAEVGGTTVDFKDDLESMPLYLPIFIGTTLDIKLVKLNLDIRYERQLTASKKSDEDARFHELVFMAGGFF